MIEPCELFSFRPEPEDGGFTADWIVPGTLPYFEGHFPEIPVLPAVAILDASVELIRRAIGRDRLVPRAIPRAKFSGPVSPGDRVAIRLERTGDGTWDVTWRDREGKTLAQLGVSV